MKYLRREKARACPVHKAVMAKAIEHIADDGTFEKAAVLNDTAFAAMANSIRWDYIRDFIQSSDDGGIGMELIALSDLFFHPTREEKVSQWSHDTTPEKYIALGHGKHTAGYVALGYNEEMDELCLRALQHRRRVATGAVVALGKHDRQTDERITPRLAPGPRDQLAQDRVERVDASKKKLGS